VAAINQSRSGSPGSAKVAHWLAAADKDWHHDGRPGKNLERRGGLLSPGPPSRRGAPVAVALADARCRLKSLNIAPYVFHGM